MTTDPETVARWARERNAATRAPDLEEARPLLVGANLSIESRQRLMATLQRLSEADDLLDSLSVPLVESAASQCDGYHLHDPRFHTTVGRHQAMINKLREVRDYVWRAYLVGAGEHEPATSRPANEDEFKP